MQNKSVWCPFRKTKIAWKIFVTFSYFFILTSFSEKKVYQTSNFLNVTDTPVNFFKQIELGIVGLYDRLVKRQSHQFFQYLFFYLLIIVNTLPSNIFRFASINSFLHNWSLHTRISYIITRTTTKYVIGSYLIPIPVLQH